jgi:hypothetical protein
MTCIMPLSNATSLPGLIGKKVSASQAVGVRRGSATMTLAPFSLALSTQRATGAWFSARLEPMMKKQSALARSGMGLVMAPLPKARARPTTVGAWHKRAQWSKLFVPSRRASFWKR